jgi:hypothetical protein
MDFLEFVCVMTVVLSSGLLLFVKMSTSNALKMQELAEKQRISQERSKAARSRYEPQEEEIAPWATELIGALGISPDSIFQDEIPPEVKMVLPMVKGFLQNGGLQKLAGQAQQPQNDPREFI